MQPWRGREALVAKSRRRRPAKAGMATPPMPPGDIRHKGLPPTPGRSEEVAEPAGKPGSVVDSHSSRRIVTDTLKQPTRTRRGPRHEVPIWPCSRWGLPCRSVAGLAVRSYRTISPLPDLRRAIGGIFLLHFPSARAAQALPGTVPCGARTFLGTPKSDATVWPAPPRALSHAWPVSRTPLRSAPSLLSQRCPRIRPSPRGKPRSGSRHCVPSQEPPAGAGIPPGAAWLRTGGG